MGYSPWGRKELVTTERLSTQPNLDRDLVFYFLEDNGFIYLKVQIINTKDEKHVLRSLTFPPKSHRINTSVSGQWTPFRHT